MEIHCLSSARLNANSENMQMKRPLFCSAKKKSQSFDNHSLTGDGPNTNVLNTPILESFLTSLLNARPFSKLGV